MTAAWRTMIHTRLSVLRLEQEILQEYLYRGSPPHSLYPADLFRYFEINYYDDDDDDDDDDDEEEEDAEDAEVDTSDTSMMSDQILCNAG
jgi:hypothetical protein